MLRNFVGVALTLGIGIVVGVIGGCASGAHSEKGTSLQPVADGPHTAVASPAPSELGVSIAAPSQLTSIDLLAQVGPTPSGQTPPSSPAAGSTAPGAASTTPYASPPATPEHLPPTPLMAPGLPEMSLDQLIQIAIANQPRIRSAQATLEGATARVGIARSGYFPRIDTTLGYRRQTANIAGGVNPATGNVTSRSVSDVSINRQDFTATLSQNVFDSFRREGNLRAAHENENAAEFDLSTTRQDVILNVQSAYYNYLLARRLVDVNQEAVQRNIQNLERAKGFFEVGTRPKIDVTRAQVDLANAELALVRARNNLAVSFATLNNAVGVPEHSLYRVTEELEIPPQMVKPEDVLAKLSESTRIALQHRTELRALRARIRSAEASLAVAKRDFLPTLSADANWNYRGQELPYAPNWSVGAAVTVPVLNPPLFSRVDEAAANLAGAQASAEITAQNIALEVQQSYADLVAGRERIRTAEVLVTEARENLSLAQGRYQVGVGPLIDVTDAELALTQAESENIQAIVDFKLAEARLRKAMGLLE